MGITEILDSGADVTLKIKSKDLKDFADHLIEKSIKGVKESFVRPEERYLTIKEVAEKLHVIHQLYGVGIKKVISVK